MSAVAALPNIANRSEIDRPAGNFCRYFAKSSPIRNEHFIAFSAASG
jgi:hypothetical protein